MPAEFGDQLLRRRIPLFQHPLRSNRRLCPDPQLAVCCFCGTTTTTSSSEYGAWRAVVRNDVQHGRASGAVVQLHPLLCAAAGAVQAVKLYQRHKKKGCLGETTAAASAFHRITMRFIALQCTLLIHFAGASSESSSPQGTPASGSQHQSSQQTGDGLLVHCSKCWQIVAHVYRHLSAAVAVHGAALLR